MTKRCEGLFNHNDQEHMRQDHSTGASCTSTLPSQGFSNKILAIVHSIVSKLCKQLEMVYMLWHPRLHNHRASLLVHLLQQTANVPVAQLAMFGIDHIAPTDLLEQLPGFAHLIVYLLLQPARFEFSIMMLSCWSEPPSAWSVFCVPGYNVTQLLRAVRLTITHLGMPCNILCVFEGCPLLFRLVLLVLCIIEHSLVK